MESALITTPPVVSASSSAAADLPLAVGPAISTAANFMGLMMSGFVVNVVGKGVEPSRFSALGAITVLSPGLDFDIASDKVDDARALAACLAWDVNLVATAQRRMMLLVADMDSTNINV